MKKRLKLFSKLTLVGFIASLILNSVNWIWLYVNWNRAQVDSEWVKAIRFLYENWITSCKLNQ